MGHEVSLTVVGVGANLRDRYRIGDRFIVQAEIYYKGVNWAYGYMLAGRPVTLRRARRACAQRR